MSSFVFAWYSLCRQPARAVLAIAGVAAIGALLFDMLLLSQGMLISFRGLLGEVGFDARVMATSSMPLTGARVGDAAATAAAIEALEEIEVVVPMRIDQAEIVRSERRPMGFTLVGSISGHGAWTVIDGADISERQADGGASTIVVNRNMASALSLSAGQTVTVRSECLGRQSILPTVEFEVVGIAMFPFDPESQLTAAVTIADFDRACGGEQDQADLFLVASRSSVTAEAAVEAIQQLRPDLYAFSNDQLVDRFERVGFSYFRQISTVLATVTLIFAFLLISVLLSVSVNQRFAEIAALRAMGFGRRRVAADLLWESGLMVSIGGALALPLGLALAIWLDRILKSMPGIPSDLHFFVVQPQAVLLHIALLATAGALAAVYPAYLASRLPIASTLRNEVVG